jgi:hypothetical protein
MVSKSVGVSQFSQGRGPDQSFAAGEALVLPIGLGYYRILFNQLRSKYH